MLAFIFDISGDFFFIFVVALIIIGPRQLPQLSRKVGKALAELKRATEDFKKSLDQEVERESLAKLPPHEMAVPREYRFLTEEAGEQ